MSLQSAKEALIEMILAEEALCAAVVAAYESGNSENQIALELGMNRRTVSKIRKGNRTRYDSINGTWPDGRRSLA